VVVVSCEKERRRFFGEIKVRLLENLIRIVDRTKKKSINLMFFRKNNDSFHYLFECMILNHSPTDEGWRRDGGDKYSIFNTAVIGGRVECGVEKDRSL
jgi:hypothetical protein